MCADDPIPFTKPWLTEISLEAFIEIKLTEYLCHVSELKRGKGNPVVDSVKKVLETPCNCLNPGQPSEVHAKTETASMDLNNYTRGFKESLEKNLKTKLKPTGLYTAHDKPNEVLLARLEAFAETFSAAIKRNFSEDAVSSMIELPGNLNATRHVPKCSWLQRYCGVAEYDAWGIMGDLIGKNPSPENIVQQYNMWLNDWKKHFQSDN